MWYSGHVIVDHCWSLLIPFRRIYWFNFSGRIKSKAIEELHFDGRTTVTYRWFHRSAHTSLSWTSLSPLTLSDLTEISVADLTKDLGVIVSSTFKICLHCQQAATGARCILLQIHRGFAVLTPEIFPPLYDQQASLPNLRRNIAQMERIHRLATLMEKGLKDMPYEDRLRRLNIFSLERRRLRGDHILAYNIFHGRLDLPRAECFEAPSVRDLRGHDFKLRHCSFQLLRKKADVSERIPIAPNIRPMEKVNSPTVDLFQRLVDFTGFSMFPCLPWLPFSLNFYLTWIEAPKSAVVFDQ